MVFNERHSSTLKIFLRAILFIKKLLGARRIQHSRFPNQPRGNDKECLARKRITLDDIDRLWRKSGKLDALFGDQLTHFAYGVDSILQNHVPEEYRLNWQSITQADINHQWSVSSTVHPAFGRQFCHFAVGIESMLQERNLKNWTSRYQRPNHFFSRNATKTNNPIPAIATKR